MDQQRDQKYEKLNLLLSGNLSSQEFLRELQELKASFLAEERSGAEVNNAQYIQHLKGLDLLDSNLDSMLNSKWEHGNLLSSVENAIFNEVLGLQIQSDELKEELQKESLKYERERRKLEKMKTQPDVIINDEIRRERNLLFRDSKFEQIELEIQEVEEQTQITHLLDDIDSKTEAVRTKTRDFQDKQKDVKDRIQERKLLLQQKIKLETPRDAEQDQLQQLNGEQIIAMLKTRIELQTQISNQQLQKEEFFDILVDFKSKYKEVQAHGGQLRQQLRQKGVQIVSEE